MRRKLIKQGKGALTVSLPKKWIDFNSLTSGDEIDVVDISNDLVLKTAFKKILKETQITLDYDSVGAYRSILGSLYRGGFDVINVKYSDVKLLSNLESAVSTLYGLDIFDVKNNGCVIKTIYDSENTNVVDHVKRIIYSIKTMQNIILTDFEKGTRESKDELLQLRANVLKQRDLVVRLIKKQKLLENNIFPYYTITLCLWGVARSYYHMYTDTNKSVSTSLLKEVIDYFNNSFKKLSNLKQKELVKKNKDYASIYSKCSFNLKKDVLASYCLNIITQIQLTDSSIFLLSHK